MAENVDNMVLEQLRLIRQEMGEMRSEMAGMKIEIRDGMGDVRSELLGQRGILVALGSYISSLDTRVEHLEERIKGPAA